MPRRTRVLARSLLAVLAFGAAIHVGSAARAEDAPPIRFAPPGTLLTYRETAPDGATATVHAAFLRAPIEVDHDDRLRLSFLVTDSAALRFFWREGSAAVRDGVFIEDNLGDPSTRATLVITYPFLPAAKRAVPTRTGPARYTVGASEVIRTPRGTVEARIVTVEQGAVTRTYWLNGDGIVRSRDKDGRVTELVKTELIPAMPP